MTTTTTTTRPFVRATQELQAQLDLMLTPSEKLLIKKEVSAEAARLKKDYPNIAEDCKSYFVEIQHKANTKGAKPTILVHSYLELENAVNTFKEHNTGSNDLGCTRQVFAVVFYQGHNFKVLDASAVNSLQVTGLDAYNFPKL